MTDSNDVDIIAQLLTDDPDIFNEMAVTTGGIAAFPGGNQKTKKKRGKTAEDEDDVEGGIKKHFIADPVTGQSKVKTGKHKSKKSGGILLADTQGCCEDEA